MKQVRKSIRKRPVNFELQITEVKKAADKALKEYNKTFKDLAIYDRGEKIFNTVSK